MIRFLQPDGETPRPTLLGTILVLTVLVVLAAIAATLVLEFDGSPFTLGTVLSFLG